MADYSREDSEYAERIVNRLISREVEGMELEPGLAVSDVEENTNVFSDELAFLEQFDAEVPAAKVADFAAKRRQSETTKPQGQTPA